MQRSYNTMVPARAGQLADAGYCDTHTLINEDPLTGQVDTITTDTNTNVHTYTFKCEGVTISYLSDASASVAEIAAGLAAAFNAEPLVNGLAEATYTATTTVFTARVAGVGWTLSDVDAKCTLVNTTANDESDPIGFGLAVVSDSANDGYGKLGKTANLAYKAVTLTPVLANTTVYNVGVTFRGTTYWADITSDADATAKEICDAMTPALNASLPAASVIVTDDDAAMTLTAEIAGEPFEITYDTALWTYAAVTVTEATDINRAFRGVSVRDSKQVTDATGVTQYAGGSAMGVLKKGRIVVDTPSVVTHGDAVYVTATGTFTPTAASTTPKLDSSVAAWVKSLSASLGVLQINARG
uniref:Tail protein n=1 Tax=viral metagenome TaxID=1070528 RepID=A0A6M3KYF9_9ZZZZ